MFTVGAYVAYLVISLGFTIWVGRTLYKNGRIFLVETFDGHEEIAESVNHLLVVGFYLINIGFVSFSLKHGGRLTELAEVFEVLSTKIGLVLIVLGVMHFFNLYVFTRLRRRASLRKEAAPVQPERILAKVVQREPALASQ